jgi:rare lipoprotein A
MTQRSDKRAKTASLGFECAFASLLLCTLFLSGCGSAPKLTSSSNQARPTSAVTKSRSVTSATPVLPKANSGQGGYYLDDGPGDETPADLESTVDPIPVVEPFSRSGNKSYKVFGKTYTPITDTDTPFKQRGMASWYGKKFHGHKTSSGELYDMYKITAAHPTLPIPSYARVTNLANNRQIIVRINDRGPFHSGRIIDLSYTAALKLGYLGKGSSLMEVERLLPEDIEKMAENRGNQVSAVSSDIAAGDPVVLPALPEARQAQNSLDALIAAQENKPGEKMDPSPVAPSGFYIQLGAYAIRANAEALMSRLRQRQDSHLPDFGIVEQGSLYRLLSGPFATREQAAAILAQSAELIVAKALVVQR